MGLRLAGLFLLLGIGGLCAQDWQTAESLPNVSLSGLTAGQKATVLKILRENGCPCGCSLKIAQCRVVDTACSYSKGLSAAVVEAIKSGKSESEAIAAAKNSRWARVQSRDRILEDAVTIPVSGSPSVGPAKAPVTLVEFSDFQCPYCAAAVPQLKALLEAYPSQVKLIFKEYPLEIHSQANLAAAAAVAANKQGKFWAMHDAMYGHYNNLSRENILILAKQAGLDMGKFESDIDSTEVREIVIRDTQDGDRAGVEGTPTLFVNGQKYNGALVASSLKQILDAELEGPAHAKTAVASNQ